MGGTYHALAQDGPVGGEGIAQLVVAGGGVVDAHALGAAGFGKLHEP
ncbi:hypothetical protein [Streptomyces sp. NPDC056821]